MTDAIRTADRGRQRLPDRASRRGPLHRLARHRAVSSPGCACGSMDPTASRSRPTCPARWAERGRARARAGSCARRFAACVASLAPCAPRSSESMGFPCEVDVDSESDDRGILGLDPSVPGGPLSMRVRLRMSAAGWDSIGSRRSPCGPSTIARPPTPSVARCRSTSRSPPIDAGAVKRPTLPVETDRLRLRSLEPDDAERLFEIYGDAETMRHVGRTRPPGGRSRGRASGPWRHSRGNEAAHGFSLWALDEREGDPLVGVAGPGHGRGCRSRGRSRPTSSGATDGAAATRPRRCAPCSRSGTGSSAWSGSSRWRIPRTTRRGG